jgi:membrane fusion protein, multidrug efflux system
MRTKQTSRLITTIGFLVVVLIVIAGCGRSKEGTEEQKVAIPEVAVEVVRAERVTITTELPGRTSAYLVAEVRPQVSGIIQRRLFTEGDDVKAGDVLYQIDPAAYQAVYDNTRAALARAEANLPSIRSRVERYKELVAIKAVSEQDYDDAAAALKQGEAEVEVAKAAAETARINLAHTRITAPISGRTGKSEVTVGALATAYQGPALTTIQQLDPIYVDATQSSVNLLQLNRRMAAGRIKGGGPDRTHVRLALEDGTPYPLDGALKFSDVTVDSSTGSFILRMVFPNPRHTLLPGMFVRALVQEGVVEDAILVAQQSISRDPKGNAAALIVDGSDKAQRRMVAIDRAIGDRWLVSSGLQPGDRVIVEGIQKVRPGMSVKAIPFSDTPKNGSGAVK